ncbi:hypothetical protein HK407_04g07900 [Ordospora pajunii]|uniref:uncharacterized protein n=1 Tax=Ordospora pajunii TaxID=3039483 RepID=UPI0029528C41|nr:uncharacterized protein HK407_04g07900 [Ordospora pajunii]KAH9411680.1 hypothetical protein HK407_04g07900 [Ordospora pajunii]
MGSAGTIRVSNLHPKIRFKDVLELFEVFGCITRFCVDGDAFLLRFDAFPDACLLMNSFPLAHRRIVVQACDQDCQDSICDGNTVVFTDDIGLDDVRDECCMFGEVAEVVKRDDGIHVVCKSAIDARNVFMNMYGRYYNDERIRCRVVSEKNGNQ